MLRGAFCSFVCDITDDVAVLSLCRNSVGQPVPSGLKINVYSGLEFDICRPIHYDRKKREQKKKNKVLWENHTYNTYHTNQTVFPSWTITLRTRAKEKTRKTNEERSIICKWNPNQQMNLAQFSICEKAIRHFFFNANETVWNNFECYLWTRTESIQFEKRGQLSARIRAFG